MGKVRQIVMGDEEAEKEAHRRAEARRETKKSKKQKPEEEEAGVAIPEAVAETAEKEARKRHMRKGNGKTRSERYRKALGMIDPKKLYPVNDAVALVKQTSYTKFDGTVEIHVLLNVDTKEKTKVIRGEVSLPHGSGKERRVVIATDEVLADLDNGKINFDVLVAEPSMMPKLAKYAKMLGPKGLMPNPKAGTVTPDPEKKVKELAGGKMNYKSEPDNPLVHLAVGKVSFEETKLSENILAVLSSFGTGKVRKASLAATMGPGIKLAV